MLFNLKGRGGEVKGGGRQGGVNSQRRGQWDETKCGQTIFSA